MTQVRTKSLFARFATALCVLVAACEPDTNPEETLALVGGRIYPSPDAEAIDNGVVLIEDGRIAFVGLSSEATLSESARLTAPARRLSPAFGTRTFISGSIMPETWR